MSLTATTTLEAKTPLKIPLQSPKLVAQNATTTTPASSNSRLLYRGALSLPDSHLLLDGLTFTTTLANSPIKLLDNSLALALESMRGRPSLRFLGTVKLSDFSLDDSVCVLMLSWHLAPRTGNFSS